MLYIYIYRHYILCYIIPYDMILILYHVMLCYAYIYNKHINQYKSLYTKPIQTVSN